MAGEFDALYASPTGLQLLNGYFVLPFAPSEADPTTRTGDPDGTTFLWISGTTLKLSTYSQTLGAWKTLTYA